MVNYVNDVLTFPFPAGGTQFCLNTEIFQQIHDLLTSPGLLELEPGLKFCRTVTKNNEVRTKTRHQDLAENKMQVLYIPETGSAQLRPSIEGHKLNRTILIHRIPEQLDNKIEENPLLGVYVLCETTKEVFGARWRKRFFWETDKKHLYKNEVIKYMLYLGSVDDLKKNNRGSMQPITEVEKPRWFVYKRRVAGFTHVQKGKKLDFVMGILIRRNKKDPLMIDIRWYQDYNTKSKKSTAINRDNAKEIENFLDKTEDSSKISENAELIAEIRKHVPAIPLESCLSSSEVMPYLGPSLDHIATSQKTLDQKIQLCCIEFFEHMLSRYKQNPCITFNDIKLQNWSYDEQTKQCNQNDTKAINNPGIHTSDYLAPWLDNNNKQQLPPHAARDLYAMGCSIANMLDLHEQSIIKNNIHYNISIQLRIAYIRKISRNIQGYAEKNKNNQTTLNNATYIEHTVLPALRQSLTLSKQDILFISAVNYLKDQNITVDQQKFTHEENKKAFTYAVFGAKNYLDQHESKKSKSKGKAVTKEFLKKLVSITPDQDSTTYVTAVNNTIETSVKGSRFFSKQSSRRGIFKAYCSSNHPPETNTSSYLSDLTQMRLSRLLNVKDTIEETAKLNRTLALFLSGDSSELHYRVLQKAIQYLECSKSGRLGKRLVRRFVKEKLCEQRYIAPGSMQNILNEMVMSQTGFFGGNKSRREFFGEFISSPTS